MVVCVLLFQLQSTLSSLGKDVMPHALASLKTVWTDIEKLSKTECEGTARETSRRHGREIAVGEDSSGSQQGGTVAPLLSNQFACISNGMSAMVGLSVEGSTVNHEEMRLTLGHSVAGSMESRQRELCQSVAPAMHTSGPHHQWMAPQCINSGQDQPMVNTCQTPVINASQHHTDGGQPSAIANQPLTTTFQPPLSSDDPLTSTLPPAAPCVSAGSAHTNMPYDNTTEPTSSKHCGPPHVQQDSSAVNSLREENQLLKMQIDFLTKKLLGSNREEDNKSEMASDMLEGMVDLMVAGTATKSISRPKVVAEADTISVKQEKTGGFSEQRIPYVLLERNICTEMKVRQGKRSLPGTKKLPQQANTVSSIEPCSRLQPSVVTDPPRRRRGRPKGSKNKLKVIPKEEQEAIEMLEGQVPVPLVLTPTATRAGRAGRLEGTAPVGKNREEDVEAEEDCQDLGDVDSGDDKDPIYDPVENLKYVEKKDDISKSKRAAANAFARHLKAKRLACNARARGLVRKYTKKYICHLCKICGKKFEHGNSFAKHLKDHGGEGSVSCRTCRKVFYNWPLCVHHKCKPAPKKRGRKGLVRQ